MTTQEAIETIKTAIAEVEWEYPMDYTVAFEMAIKVLEAQPEQVNLKITGTRKHKSDFSDLDAQPEQRWIPVSKETNPKKSGWYLVTISEEMTADDKRYSGMAEYNATTGEWYDGDEPTDCYLAWQNLPEPSYKEDE